MSKTSISIASIASVDFEKEVLQAENVVVDFYSTECPPCDALALKYEHVSRTYGNDVKFIKIFRQENRSLAESLGIRSSPTLLFFKNGYQVGEVLSGAIKRKDLCRNLDALLSPERAQEIRAAIKPSQHECDVLILGAGPAGLTAAIYTSQAHLHTILVDSALPGGQVNALAHVSNYPGFIEAQPGFLLMHAMNEQAKKAGVEYRVAVDVTGIDLAKKEVRIDDIETIHAKKIILATGSTPRSLNIPGEKEYKGKGISYCATCDAKYYEGKQVVVIGGKDAALEETLFIARFAAGITLLHSGAAFQAHKSLQDKIFAQDKITVQFSVSLKEFKRTKDGSMLVVGRDEKKQQPLEIKADGIFIFTGMRPKLAGLEEVLDHDDKGYVRVDACMHTNIPDVFAAGDVISKPYRQITLATAEGTIAAMTITKEL